MHQSLQELNQSLNENTDNIVPEPKYIIDHISNKPQEDEVFDKPEVYSYEENAYENKFVSLLEIM